MDLSVHSAESFSYAGHYRVQSRHAAARSTLGGAWFHGAPGLLDADTVNAALRAHPLWQGQASVNLHPAHVSSRTGMFATEPDILYKRDFFRAATGTPPMEFDIVDVRKSVDNWRSRTSITRSLFAGDTYGHILAALPDLNVVIANEYYLHEAGHFVGYDVLAKYREGYFAPGGRTAWPLIYLEEARADLQAFGCALRVLPAPQAVQIFLYNVALRFGVQRQGFLHHGTAPYGLVPYFLFCVLRDLEFLSVVRIGGRPALQLASLDAREVTVVMQRCAAHAESQLSAPELALASPMDRAFAAARYIRHHLDDQAAAAEYASIVNS